MTRPVDHSGKQMVQYSQSKGVGIRKEVLGAAERRSLSLGHMGEQYALPYGQGFAKRTAAPHLC